MKNDKAPVCGIHGIKKAGTCVQQRPANPNVQRCHPFWSATTHTIFSLVWITNPNPKKKVPFSPAFVLPPQSPHPKEFATLPHPTRKSPFPFPQGNRLVAARILVSRKPTRRLLIKFCCNTRLDPSRAKENPRTTLSQVNACTCNRFRAFSIIRRREEG